MRRIVLAAAQPPCPRDYLSTEPIRPDLHLIRIYLSNLAEGPADVDMLTLHSQRWLCNVMLCRAMAMQRNAVLSNGYAT